METNVLILASLLVFSPASTSTSLPNLCDDVYLDEDGAPLHDSSGMTLSRYCEWTGPRAPKWAASVCCSFTEGEADCAGLSSTGSCDAGESRMWCDHGKQALDGSVTCYQSFPSACDAGHCVEAPAGATQELETPLCCLSQGCFELQFEEYCPGLFMFCSAPYSLPDGTVGCDE